MVTSPTKHNKPGIFWGSSPGWFLELQRNGDSQVTSKCAKSPCRLVLRSTTRQLYYLVGDDLSIGIPILTSKMRWDNGMVPHVTGSIDDLSESAGDHTVFQIIIAQNKPINQQDPTRSVSRESWPRKGAFVPANRPSKSLPVPVRDGIPEEKFFQDCKNDLHLIFTWNKLA